MMTGDKLYQVRARRALPLLVRQAEAGEPILYSHLAQELEVVYPPNLNYPLGRIGQALERLSKEWKEKIPPIQCLVINKKTRLPSEGIVWFPIKKDEFSALPRSRQREIVKAQFSRIFAYQRWREVLEFFSLPYRRPDVSELMRGAAGRAGGDESADHLRLKKFIARNPRRIGLSTSNAVGQLEAPLPSGDSIDVSFDIKDEWVAAEIKSLRSSTADIARGMFQCVKYRALMEAAQSAKGARQASRAVLVLQGELPSELVPLRNILGLEVFELVSP